MKEMQNNQEEVRRLELELNYQAAKIAALEDVLAAVLPV